MPIVWTKDYSIGVEEIDSQHKKLILLINRLEVLSTFDSSKKEFEEHVKLVINDLISYTVLHFSTEEVLMRMFDYEDFEDHKKTHDKFIELVASKQKKIQDLFQKNEAEQVKILLKTIFDFLQNWLINHILKSDAEYTEFFLAIKKKAKKSGGWFSFLKD